MAKERVDVLCVEQGLFESREKAKLDFFVKLYYNNRINSARFCANFPQKDILCILMN